MNNDTTQDRIDDATLADIRAEMSPQPMLTEAAAAKTGKKASKAKAKKIAKTPAKKSVKAQTKKVAKTPPKTKKVAKIEPKLPTAAVERLRNGTSSIPVETKTLGLSYSIIQRCLKRELGAAGYTALIKANRAAKSKVTTPNAKPAKAASKRSRKAK